MSTVATSSGTVTITIDQAAVHRMLRSHSGAVGQFMTRLTNLAQNKGRQGAPVATGLMRSRTEGRIVEGSEGVEGELAARTNYARWVNDGTQYMAARPFLTDAAASALHQMTRP